MSAYIVPYIRLLGLTIVPVMVGVILRRRGVSKKTATRIFLAVLFGFQLPIVFLSIWTARITAAARYLPLLTLAAWFITMGIARGVSGLLKHEPRQRGSFIMSMCLSNHGYTLLGLIVFVLFGHEGLSQASYAQMGIVPFLFLVCFPAARYYGSGGADISTGRLIKDSLTDPRILPLAAMLIGLMLNISGIARPSPCAKLLPYLVYVGTILSGLAVGILFGGFKLGKYARENVFSFVYRLTIYPAIFAGLACICGLGVFDTRILILFGLVPSALFSNMVSDFFDLDTDMTASIFAVGGLLFMFLVLPIYAFIVLSLN
ncbi:MAG: hypothetical protein E4H02_13425 [Lentisphaerales bacterium]|nr:MAG: hypothetical protein E4H02_13425 [Lentisphaerales bacterium]